jgi:hypothetical protein
MNQTHDPALTSWINRRIRPTPIFPYRIFLWRILAERRIERRVGVAIGDRLLASENLERESVEWKGARCRAVVRSTNAQRADAGVEGTAVRFRARLSELLAGTPGDDSVINPLHPARLSDVGGSAFLAAQIGNYTDFYLDSPRHECRQDARVPRVRCF